MKNSEISTLNSFLQSAYPSTSGPIVLTIEGSDPNQVGSTIDVGADDVRKVKEFIENASPNGVVASPLDRPQDPITLSVWGSPGANGPEKALLPSIHLEHTDGRRVATYLINGTTEEVDTLVRDLEKDFIDREQTELYGVNWDVPVPGGNWQFVEEPTFQVYTASEWTEAIFYGATLGQEAYGLSAEHPGPPQPSHDPTFNIKDMAVWGEPDPAIHNRTIRVSVGANREAQKFQSFKTGTFAQFVQNFLTEHTVGKKDGKCFVCGDLADGKRTKNSVLGMSMMGIDVDSGASMDATFKLIRDIGLHAILYTTHSHGTTRVTIKQDKYFRWATTNALDTAPTTENVRKHLMEEGKYTADVIASAEFVSIEHDSTGMHLIVQTRPIDKFRAVLPLATDYVIAEQGTSQRDAVNRWAEMIMGMGKLLGITVDRAATDPSRLFYLPRHGAGAQNFKIVMNAGRALDWNHIERVNPREKVSSDPFDQAGHVMGGRLRGRTVSPQKGLDLAKWAAERADGFAISQVFKDNCEERLRGETSAGKFTCECPFDEDHSNPGDNDDKGCFIQDSGEDVESFIFRCSHDSCSGRDRLKMLEKAMIDGWFTDNVLNDDNYYVLLDDESKNASCIGLEQSVRSAVAKMRQLERVDSALLEVICKGLALIKKPTLEAEILSELTAAPIKLRKSSFDESIKAAKADAAAIIKKAAHAANGKGPIINVREDGFDEQCRAVRRGLAFRNVDRPFLFETDSVPKRLKINRDGTGPVLEGLGQSQFKYECNEAVTCYDHDRIVNLPDDVPAHLHGAPTQGFALLDRIVRHPIHALDGTLAVAPGYDAGTKCYLYLDKLNVPPVSSCPTDAEVADAVALLCDELLVDFPASDAFGQEIFDKEGNAVPDTGAGSRANAVAMCIHPFMRNLCEGPTPFYFVDKPKAGTGAGLLASAGHIIANGEDIAAQSLPEREEEVRKMLTSVVMGGQGVLFLDNVENLIAGSALAIFGTAELWTDRVLGRSEMTKMRIRCQTILTGNKLRPEDQMARRMVPIYMDARTARPDKRTGFKHPELKKWVKANRAKLVWACLTIVANWFAKGKPKGKIALASFEDYTLTMGGILDAAGIDGFLSNLGAFDGAKRSEDDDETVFMQLLFDAASKQRQLAGFTCELVHPIAYEDERLQYDFLGKEALGAAKQKAGLSKALTASCVGKTYRLSIGGSLDGESTFKQFTLVSAGLQPGTKAKRWKFVQQEEKFGAA